MLVFVFAAWLVTRTLSSLYRGRATELDLLWIGLRASALIAVASTSSTDVRNRMPAPESAGCL